MLFYDEGSRLVASTAQEGLIRVRPRWHGARPCAPDLYIPAWLENIERVVALM